eukprot:CAMPEP_0118634504 /NCGR_PEP_ID=MMETSP0785-20121206/1583_1 /TAXON_ID=91992 /ORGANISM="Bolidomonas pacifica, Strain CCMP 1866" /LENGTH=213 /DNA_ID=CAMNT_0006525485 /DNA_START=26 /DNA_END=667 /DNA_ORIENTATION=+
MTSFSAFIFIAGVVATSSFHLNYPQTSSRPSNVNLYSEVADTDTKFNVFEDYVGNSDFRGKRFDFDPLNLAAAYPPFVPFFREAELRHGRTAMLAVLGFISTDFIRIPGDMYSFDSIPKTIDIHDALLKNGPMYQLLLWIGLWDILVTAPSIKALGEGFREPGDYGWRWFAPESKEGFDVKRDAELKNGRLAMIAVGGIATQSIITGHGFPYV